MEEAWKALASVMDTHPKSMNRIWDFLEKEKEHYVSILEAFKDMKTSVDLEKLFSIVDIDLTKWRPKEALKTVIIKAGKQAKPLLFEMIQDPESIRYDFARECLEEIGVSIEEYSKVFEKSPILQIYEFFHRKRKSMLLKNLWKDQDKLRNPIKNAQMDNFEYFIHHLFSALGFVTLFVDPSGEKGVDLIAFHPNKPIVLIIGCTTSILKYDLEKLNMTLIEMEDALKDLLLKYRILPMVFISRKVGIHDADMEYAGKKRMAILTYEEITTLLEMLRTNRGSEEIMKQIELSIPIPDIDNPYE
jgi:hypothetical protein